MILGEEIIVSLLSTVMNISEKENRIITSMNQNWGAINSAQTSHFYNNAG